MTAVRHLKEFTIRGVVIGILITLVFTAAQVYLGLKVGLTFATSIPAAVISMALLQAFRNASIQENNIVQTIASSAGALAAVIFVLPGLMIIGWWQHVHLVTAFAACAIGGVLGVMYTMPLRRALVTQSDLPYPEGVAAAEVLRVGTASREGGEEGRLGLWAVVWGALASALYAAAAGAKLLAGEISAYFKVGAKGATGIGGSASLALIGAGHLMGITVGIAMLAGLVIAWGILVPVMTHLNPMPALSLADHAGTIWSTDVRFIGAGAIGTAAIWTLGKLAVPVWSGLMSALKTRDNRLEGSVIPRIEQDLPVWVVGVVVLISMVPAGWLLASFLSGGPLSAMALPLVVGGVLYILIAGLLAAAVCGYMAGLIGSSNSPVSGVAILTVLGAAFLAGLIGFHLTGPDTATALIAFALLVTTVVLAVSVIGNDNLQDLKTGQLVDATPWKQQVALIIGTLAGSLVVPPVLELLNNSYGFAGDPHYHGITHQPLPAPQATLITTLAKGVISGGLDWGLIGIGALIGLGLVVMDLVLRKLSRDRFSLPPLGVGLAIYLPSVVTAPVVIGAFGGWLFNRLVRGRTVGGHDWGEAAQRLGVLIASGFIVGESLLNVALAAIIVVSKNPAPFAGPFAAFAPSGALSMWIALILAVIGVVGLYGWAADRAKKLVAKTST
ncbi:oligopeptide transporter, OPT family [Asticcacaulis sp. EMRT-3]|uniref:OPT family oligopeptide transporter n=1 Tax=Asticcacaulis sp. EMRT-3 TaxID=3040349 RepID=UPI0024AF5767|nr:oligopeptide transporter, OPT family [Asticcacaulis sp. EMRT-3]MDI7774140.1 oligopeptide transporter, OPT family [Asticcacaulis sp. EMRT-3]